MRGSPEFFPKRKGPTDNITVNRRKRVQLTQARSCVREAASVSSTVVKQAAIISRAPGRTLKQAEKPSSPGQSLESESESESESMPPPPADVASEIERRMHAASVVIALHSGDHIDDAIIAAAAILRGEVKSPSDPSALALPAAHVGHGRGDERLRYFPDGTCYTCRENDRPQSIAKALGINQRAFIAINLPQFPNLTSSSRMKAGTHLYLPSDCATAAQVEMLANRKIESSAGHAATKRRKCGDMCGDASKMGRLD